MSILLRQRVTAIGLALAIFLADQWLKRLMLGPLDLRRQPGGAIEILPFFDLRWTENYGVSLGMLTADTMEMRWLLVLMTSAIALFVFIWMLREKALGDILALALVLGGALGNIRDRVLHGYVIDYADLHFGSFRPFLIFNLADAAITIGVVIILARTLLSREKPETVSQDAPES